MERHHAGQRAPQQQAIVYGTDIIATPENLNVPGLPSEVASLVRETLLLDTERAGVMASLGTPPNPTGAPTNLAPVQVTYTSAIQGVPLARDSHFNSAVLQTVSLDGSQPSAIAIKPWQDLFDPMFLDSNYSHPYSKFDDWKLDASDVEMTLPVADANFPPSSGVLSFTERSMVTVTVVNVLKSALVKRTSIDPQGQTTRFQIVDPSLTQDYFTKMDVVSALLTKFDSQLYEGGLPRSHFGTEGALLPPPEVAGYSAEFLYQAPDATTSQSSKSLPRLHWAICRCHACC